MTNRLCRPSERGTTAPPRRVALIAAGCVLAAVLGGSAGAAGPSFVAAPGSPFAVGTNPHSIAVADLNGDRKADLAVANYGSNSVSIEPSAPKRRAAG